MLFFFSIGAGFNLDLMGMVVVPAVVMTVVVIIIKPLVFGFLLRKVSEKPSIAWEVGFRLGQTSEFSI